MGDTLSGITVKYTRRRTDKKPDGSFDSFEVGADITQTFGGGDVSKESLVSAWQLLFLGTKAQVDLELEAALPEPETVEAVGATAGQTSWVERTVAENTESIQSRVMPGEHLSGAPSSGVPQVAMDEHGTPDASLLHAMAESKQAVTYQHCKVFEVTHATASTGNPYVNIRIGARGPDGIPGQYTTAESWDQRIIEETKQIRDGDFVDVWGYFKPWKNNPDRFNLVTQKIERSRNQ